MKKIRVGWETNSSSSHAIAKVGDDRYVSREELVPENYEWTSETLYVRDAVWHPHWNGEGFGRLPFRILTTFQDKFYYAVCEYLGYMSPQDDKYDETIEMFENLVADICWCDIEWETKEIDIYEDEDGNEIPSSALIFVGYEWDRGNRIEVYNYPDADGNLHRAKLSDEVYNVPDVGCIDHQSAGLLRNFLKKEGISLKEFLTNRKYIIVIDGDEYNEWDELKRSGVVNLANIKEEFYG